ncbi:MAG: hypothetical protein LBK63_01485 [Treponema sp.]|jgi:hypothetical protein|nr:hypothetical protein [Treponema sp.]
MKAMWTQRNRWAALAFVLTAGGISAQGIDVSGVLDSVAGFALGAEGAEGTDHSWGAEEYANLRFKAGTGEQAVVYGAFNFIAAAGSSASALAAAQSSAAERNYLAAMELERLYFRANGEYMDAEAGLMRLAFGYGQTWASSDFLNPRSPLFPDARPRGVLAASFAFYPGDSLKLTAFGAAPKAPLDSGGGGLIPGLSLDRHWDRASLQALYAFETPGGAPRGIPGETPETGLHRFGLSLKADLELGLVADILYTLDPSKLDGLDGLSAGAGFDYSFFRGKFYVLAEYLFNGASSVTAAAGEGYLSNSHYLYATVRYAINDYAGLSLADTHCLEDLSFMPALSLDYELFQGFVLTLTAKACLDQETLSGGAAGEFGPAATGSRGDLRLKASLRF